MRSPFPPLSSRPVALAALLVPAACSSAPRTFDEVFPDPEALLTTPDPDGARQALATVLIPDTEAHRERLLAALRNRDRVSGARLALLAAAMTSSRQRQLGDETHPIFWPARGRGTHAGPTDALLTLGLPKLEAVTRREFGQLIGHTQSDEVLRDYCERFLPGLRLDQPERQLAGVSDRFGPDLDDGSDAALIEILAGMRGSPATAPFLSLLAMSGRLDGTAALAAFAQLAFDDDRVTVLAALVARGQPIGGEQLLTVLRAFAFDDGRERAFALLAQHLRTLTPEQTGAAVATFTFDSGKQAAFASLGVHGGVSLSDEHLLAMARLCLFDGTRLQCVQRLAPRLVGPADGQVAVQLLKQFSFDGDRRSAVEAMASRWRSLDAATKERLLATFLFDSERQRAAALL